MVPGFPDLLIVDDVILVKRENPYPEMPARKLMLNPIPTGPWIDILWISLQDS